MGVKPVEYKKDSSTQGFAVAGDKKDITKTTANTIKKDVDQGNTQDLDNAQSRYLEQNIDYDNIEYTEEENKNVGKNQIDTEGADKNSDGGVAGSTVATGIAVAAGTTFAVTTQVLTTGHSKLCYILDGFSQAALGAVMTVLAATSLGLTFTFDKTLGDKENQTGQADANNQLIQQYYDELTGNMDSMDEESANYAELCEAQLQSDVELIDQIGELQAQIIEYRAQGNEEKVAELQKQIEELQKGAEEDTGNRDEMGTIKDNLELYTSRNAEAQGVSESGNLVSDFLKQGHAYKTWAIINATALGVCGLLCASTVCIPKLAPFFIDAIPSTLGKALFIAAGLTFVLAATRMSTIAKKEGDAADAGDQMGGYVKSLNENIEAQAGYTEVTGAGYVEADGAAAEEVTKTQEGVDKANQNLNQTINPPVEDPEFQAQLGEQIDANPNLINPTQFTIK